MNFTNGNNGNNGYNNNGYNNGNTDFNQNLFNNGGYNGNGYNNGYNGYNNGYNNGFNNGYNNYNNGFNNGYNNGFNNGYNNGFNNNYNNNYGAQQVKQSSSFMDSFANPRVKHLSKFGADYAPGAEAASFGGIAAKTVYFVLTFALGLAAFFYLHYYFGKTGTADGQLLYPQEYPILIGACIATLVSALVTAFAPKTTAFFGTIYCVGMGYLVTWTSYTYAAEYKGIVYEALGLTLLIIGVLTVLYSKGIIRVTSRFRKVVYTTLLVSILGGLIFFVMTLVAPNSGIVRAIIQANNGPIGFVFGIIGVMLASAVLTCDFDNAAKTVEQGLPKGYEWAASFGLVTGVIYLYLKVLQLLARIQNNK